MTCLGRRVRLATRPTRLAAPSVLSASNSQWPSRNDAAHQHFGSAVSWGGAMNRQGTETRARGSKPLPPNAMRYSIDRKVCPTLSAVAKSTSIVAYAAMP
jgi:hypothetical protein